VDHPSDGGIGSEADAVQEVRPSLIVLPAGTEDPLGNAEPSFGVLGRPFNHRAPFFVGLMAALGVAVAYVVARGIADISDVLVLIGLSLFLAIGLNPILQFLELHGRSRGFAVGVVILGFAVVVGAFALAAIPPISNEVHSLITNYARYKAELASGKGWLGRLVVKLHLTRYFQGKSTLHVPTQGILGAGKVLLSVGVAVTSVFALTIYFLIALPGVKALWLSLVPRSRRGRVELLTEEVFSRVGGFMLGNLVTSVISGVGTFLWLIAFGVPYAFLLALMVAIFDLIPVVGSTIAGIIVSLVALTKGLPVGIATGAFYAVYRLLEDYFLVPRVMKHTVRVSPGLTIVATLIGGALLGLIGALVAIPVAATIHLLIEEVAIPRQNQH
jgi:predicted PurR-regulated permease PerM